MKHLLSSTDFAKKFIIEPMAAEKRTVPRDYFIETKTYSRFIGNVDAGVPVPKERYRIIYTESMPTGTPYFVEMIISHDFLELITSRFTDPDLNETIYKVNNLRTFKLFSGSADEFAALIEIAILQAEKEANTKRKEENKMQITATRKADTNLKGFSLGDILVLKEDVHCVRANPKDILSFSPFVVIDLDSANPNEIVHVRMMKLDYYYKSVVRIQTDTKYMNAEDVKIKYERIGTTLDSKIEIILDI